MSRISDFLVRPDPKNPSLTEKVAGIDQGGQRIETSVPVERPLALYLNNREIVTLMTVGDFPECLAVGYLINQNMLRPDDRITDIEYDEIAEAVVVRTEQETDFEEKLARQTRTSGCALGTIFGDILETFEDTILNPEAKVHTSWLYALTAAINSTPSLYTEAGGIHGCVLCDTDRPLIYMEDVGRHNAVDKIAGYMYLNGISADGKIFYTTGRLTSEMVIKTVQMNIPILISRSGFTAWGVELARKAGLTLIGRARGKRFVALSGEQRIIYDTNSEAAAEEPAQLRRKAAAADT
tara:strand:- start:6593 stop:7477 length:885 start_codon:yes stop_codon:yes gene_type:complete